MTEKTPLLTNRVNLDEVNNAIIMQRQKDTIESSERAKNIHTQIVIDLLAIANKEHITQDIINRRTLNETNIVIYELKYNDYTNFYKDRIFNDQFYNFELLLTTPIAKLNIYHDKLICNNMNLSVLEIISAIIPEGFYLHTIPGYSHYKNDYVHKIYISKQKTPITDPCCFSLCCGSCLLEICCCCFGIGI